MITPLVVFSPIAPSKDRWCYVSATIHAIKRGILSALPSRPEFTVGLTVLVLALPVDGGGRLRAIVDSRHPLESLVQA
jgi:hypothetical protein